MTAASLGTGGLAVVVTTILGMTVANGTQTGPARIGLRRLAAGAWIAFGLTWLADILNIT